MKYSLCFLPLFLISVCNAQIDVLVDKNFSFHVNGNELTVPFESSHPIDLADDEIKYGIIVVHGVNRNADEYYTNMLVAANMAPQDSDSTIYLAPQFLTESDIDAFSLPTSYIYWTSGGWSAGSLSRNEATNPRPVRISSYAVVDSLINRILTNIPSLEEIVLVGHSAGGQFVHRHALSSPIHDTMGSRFPVRYVVMNPSSFAYMDDTRRISGTIDQFEVPNTSCSSYNEWKYGLEDLFSYPGLSTVEEIRNRYKKVNVAYVIGGADNDPNDAVMDMACEAQLQGSHRLERASIYFNHLQNHYQEIIHTLDTVPGVAHSHSQMFVSPVGIDHIFRKKGSYDTTTSINQSQKITGQLILYPNPTGSILNIINPISDKSIAVEVFDVLGRKMLKIEHTIFSNDIELDISRLRSGIYSIHLFSTTERYINQFIVRQ
ncbi:MAG: T9SS type A sorting domain-containing protein [Bacteroidia bacterium]|nr:T9SS type A sorting domain-containing protein [Bacteroidia bacterium]